MTFISTAMGVGSASMASVVRVGPTFPRVSAHTSLVACKITLHVHQEGGDVNDLVHGGACLLYNASHIVDDGVEWGSGCHSPTALRFHRESVRRNGIRAGLPRPHAREEEHVPTFLHGGRRQLVLEPPQCLPSRPLPLGPKAQGRWRQHGVRAEELARLLHHRRRQEHLVPRGNTPSSSSYSLSPIPVEVGSI